MRGGAEPKARAAVIALCFLASFLTRTGRIVEAYPWIVEMMCAAALREPEVWS